MNNLDSTKKATILVVDDLPDNLALMNSLLKESYKVKVAASGDKALEIAASDAPPDLILLDIMMPGMDGHEVCRRLKRDPKSMDIPVIFLTAKSEEEDEQIGLGLGAVDYITKPISPPIVMARVKSHLALKASHDLIRSQRDEAKQLYERLLAEQKRSNDLILQPGTMVGVEKEERFTTPWFRSLMLRHTWLLFNLLAAFAAGAVVYSFQGTIDRLLILTIFLPILTSQANNTGSQALAVTLRGIALGDLVSGKERALVIKEALLGLLNGVVVGLIAGLGMYTIANFQDLPNAPMLSAVLFLSMIGSCIIGGITGAFVPLILKRLGADPIAASSILLSTVTDVASIGMFLGLAMFLVK
ncbi:MAG: response regulator [Rhodoferax sp.]|nr:response regulator [Rhodoferax sp.]